MFKGKFEFTADKWAPPPHPPPLNIHPISSVQTLTAVLHLKRSTLEALDDACVSNNINYFLSNVHVCCLKSASATVFHRRPLSMSLFRFRTPHWLEYCIHMFKSAGTPQLSGILGNFTFLQGKQDKLYIWGWCPGKMPRNRAGSLGHSSAL